MEHFLLIGKNIEQCSYITGSLKKHYPGSNIVSFPALAEYSLADAKNISIVILLKDVLPDDPALPISTMAASNIVIFIADTDDEGIAAIGAGAEDHVLSRELKKNFINTIRKALARKRITPVYNDTIVHTGNTKEAYELMLSSMNEVVWSRSTDDFKLVYINNACELLFGYTQEELIDDLDLFIDRMHPDDRVGYLGAFHLMQDSGHLQEYEFRFQCKDGTWKFFKGKGALVKGEDGEEDLLTGITVDITKLITSETVIKEKTKELEEILESISDCFYSVDEQWNFTYINRALEELFQVHRNDLLGKNLWEAFPLLKGTLFYDNYHSVVQDKKNISFEGFSPNIKKWIAVSAYPGDNGLTIFFKDITERKELEIKTFADQQDLLSIINNTSDIIWSVDMDLNILVANQAFWDSVTRTFGKTKEEMGNRISEEAYGKETVQYWQEIYRHGYNGNAFKMVEMNTSVLGVTYSEISMNPIHNAAGQVIGLACFSRDITKTREYMTQIEEQNQKLRDIAWIQSHKVRGPVSTILGLVAVLDMSGTNIDENRTILEGIKETAQYLDDVIREIVAKARAIEQP